MTQEIDFGTDLSWADDLDPSGRMVTGIELLGQSAFRRLRTPRGACLDAPDDGLDVQEYLSRAMTPAALAAIPGEIAQEITKDERFLAADVTLTPLPDGFHLAIEITPAAGPSFELTLSVGEAAVTLLGIT